MYFLTHPTSFSYALIAAGFMFTLASIALTSLSTFRDDRVPVGDTVMAGLGVTAGGILMALGVTPLLWAPASSFFSGAGL